jgi:hypothetical protein
MAATTISMSGTWSNAAAGTIDITGALEFTPRAERTGTCPATKGQVRGER